MTPEHVIAAVVVGVVVVLLGSAELGFQMGRQSRHEDAEEVSQVGNWEGALLGMLALLIGFTFAMAVTRFDSRRELILDEANAIGKLARRAQYMPASVQQQMHGLLLSYVEARVRSYDAGHSRSRTEDAYLEAAALQRRLWAVAADVARDNFNSEMASLFVEATDGVIEQGARRRAALDNHVPTTVLVLLLLVASIAVGATGYSCGLRLHRHRFGMILLPILIGAVVLLVVDIDYPRAGLVRAGQGPMLRVQQTLEPPLP